MGGETRVVEREREGRQWRSYVLADFYVLCCCHRHLHVHKHDYILVDVHVSPIVLLILLIKIQSGVRLTAERG